MSTAGQRIDYDAIADRYDAQPFRAKDPDPDLAEFLAAREGAIAALDLCCGTGNQQLANRTFSPRVRLTGADLFLGMLRQAAGKSRELAWVQADGARLPFHDGAFDFVSSQFSFHHVRDRKGLVDEVHRVLRPGGRFVLSNICPEGMPGWAIYRYFPAAAQLDARDFLPAAEHARLFRDAGFEEVRLERSARTFETDLRGLSALVRQRAMNSELVALSDEDYRLGLARIDAELEAAGGRPAPVPDEVCLLKVIGDRRG